MNQRSSEIIQFPQADEIAGRLKEVFPIGNLSEEFGQFLKEEAGRELSAMSIYMMLIQKINDFDLSAGFHPSLTLLLKIGIPEMIDALIDDVEVAREAKKLNIQ